MGMKYDPDLFCNAGMEIINKTSSFESSYRLLPQPAVQSEMQSPCGRGLHVLLKLFIFMWRFFSLPVHDSSLTATWFAHS